MLSTLHCSRLILAMVFMLATGFAQAAEITTRSGFNHVQTGFPLLGAHAQADCQSCHLQGVFKGTPRQCEVCHTQGSRMASTFKQHNHPQTAMPCSQCHVSQMSWSGARFDHIGVAPGSCAGCHNGITATGKSTRHIFTTSSCDTCHRTTAWVPAGYNHSGVLPGTCTTCHGITATGKPGGHVVTALECDQCHTTRNWSSSGYNHAGVVPGTCGTCHGVTATGKPNGHVITNLSCDQCHRTTAWRPARFNHTNAVAGQCATCHGVTATGKHAGHIPTNPANLSCDACHRTNQSFSSSTFQHTVAQGVGPTGCFTCHNGNYRNEGADGRPNNGEHPNNNTCETCHTTSNWDPIGGNRALNRRTPKKR
jgi:Cytochrome c7 and related cytochrome c